MDKVKEITDIMVEKYGKDAAIKYLQAMLEIVIGYLMKTDREFFIRTFERHINEEK